LKSAKGLSMRQKAIYRKVQRAGLKPVAYHRAKYSRGSPANRKSIHDPFLDLMRKADKAKPATVARYPQARDTPRQRSSAPRRVRLTGRKPSGFFKGLLYP
jgi:hypothetical protein